MQQNQNGTSSNSGRVSRDVRLVHKKHLSLFWLLLLKKKKAVSTGRQEKFRAHVGGQGWIPKTVFVNVSDSLHFTTKLLSGEDTAAHLLNFKREFMNGILAVLCEKHCVRNTFSDKNHQLQQILH